MAHAVIVTLSQFCDCVLLHVRSRTENLGDEALDAKGSSHGGMIDKSQYSLTDRKCPRNIAAMAPLDRLAIRRVQSPRCPRLKA